LGKKTCKTKCFSVKDRQKSGYNLLRAIFIKKNYENCNPSFEKKSDCGNLPQKMAEVHNGMKEMVKEVVEIIKYLIFIKLLFLHLKKEWRKTK
jgi:hypothetical protein